MKKLLILALLVLTAFVAASMHDGDGGALSTAPAHAVVHNMPVSDGNACHAPYNLGDPNWYPVGSFYPYTISGNYTVAYANPWGPYILGAYYWPTPSMYCGYQSYIHGYAWIAG